MDSENKKEVIQQDTEIVLYGWNDIERAVLCANTESPFNYKGNKYLIKEYKDKEVTCERDIGALLVKAVKLHV